ncbi:MAG TPA: MtnX-like HAD-IB family phosphatase [Dehalococcoidia bacterium]|jgi:2,3-diketo-5-methylthio-1-phosphopentane phosphatase|nr:hypothetical protein [Chloroflexota bacterium]MDP5878112.1 MtnX-like HAD-IB family phosphatase [Dehalococcoidia bacterium]MDP7213908.1 MtnX-like HAD-IB family phosphatase [Dehalococcoidia bacterium]HCV26838.1 hypothetical protein [Dehalococcoidia bacterium]HJM53081.1 MtnX-like HAD-IB family phosphatase [Dehalococcoidia bacterium]|tara:strand:+ start:678 stop:1355 length:678 start_codon:yes stop_codon:yes gene_type:complete
MKLALVLDFDGTITMRDIGVEVIKKFARSDWDEGLRRWRASEFDQRQLMEWDFARLPSGRLSEMREYSLSVAVLRPGLTGLLELCRSNDMPVEVVSNGMAFYVEAVLEREGLSDLAFVAPTPTFAGLDPETNDPVSPVAEFGIGVETCERTGLCKCARAARLRPGGRKIVFVGDGISDFCIAEEEADFVIARSALKDHCAANGIAHSEFDDFYDVAREIESLLAG